MMININKHQSGNTQNPTVPTSMNICEGQDRMKLVTHVLSRKFSRQAATFN